MIDFDTFKLKGYDDKRNQLANVRFLARLEKNGRFLPTVNNRFIVVSSIPTEGSYIYDLNFNLLERIQKINGNQVAPIIVYNDTIYFQDTKSRCLVKYNVIEAKTYQLSNNIRTGLSFNVSRYFVSGGGLGEQQLCYDLENDRIVWEQKLTEGLSQHVSDGEVLITEAMDWSFKIGRELKTA